jgi:hypothetical protein
MLKVQRSCPEHVTDKPYIPSLRDVCFQPIFILGNPRSGTTLLYELLVATQCFNYINAYHIIRYDELLFNRANQREDQARNELGELFRALGLGDRIIDGVAVTPDTPEEYGFILKNAGYRPQLSRSSLPKFDELCKKIQSISASGRPLLLKNPRDFRNFMYVKDVFPESKFIFIHRHPLQVINSQLRAMRSLLVSQNLYTGLLDRQYAKLFERPVRLFMIRQLFSPRVHLGLRRVTRGMVRGTTYFVENIGSLLNTEAISVTYENLCADPAMHVARILQFLGLPRSAPLADDALVAPRHLELLPELVPRQHSICRKLQPYCACCGYTG